MKLSEENYEMLGVYSERMNGTELLNFIKAVMIKFKSNPLINFSNVTSILKNFQPAISKSIMNNYVKFVEKYGEKL